MTAKVHINLTQGIFEVEGEPDFVRGIYDDFKSELAKLAVTKQLSARTNDNPKLLQAQSTEILADDEAEMPALPVTTANKKKGKRPANVPPKGHSCPDRMMVLRGKGFFKTHKTPGDIVKGLAQEGWTHKSNQVSAAALSMFNRGDIQRTNSGGGFSYYWDRE